MWMDFFKFIIKALHSILIVITIIYLFILYYESKGFSKTETKKKLLSFVKLYFIFMGILYVIGLFIIIFYQFKFT
ncbi:hypothetical protein CER18_07395 [Bartonella tribocorum]|uniref:Uncharacterized protein n=1 Tax=Bartonella tribocorum TaxID=85701 RepID=A0A2N9Y9A7_9HYPH|nr:hypothetical protein CER18_07395 [Bartonella tribocorum]